MTTVWSLRHNVTDFNYLVSLDQQGAPPLGEGTSQLETWEPRQVWYHPLDFEKDLGMANFPRWSAVSIVCDAVAKEIIHKLLADHVEFLPLAYYGTKFLDGKVSDSKYSAINVLKILDCLDHKRIEFSYYGSLKYISQLAFKPNCIGGTPIFKLPIQNSISTYVTNEFKQLVEDNNLTGLKFRKVWEG